MPFRPGEHPSLGEHGAASMFAGPLQRVVRHLVLQIIRGDAGVLRDSGEHLWANFLSVVKSEDEICISGTAKRAV